MVKVWKVFFDRAFERSFGSLFACFLAFLKANCCFKMPVMQPFSRALVASWCRRKDGGRGREVGSTSGSRRRAVHGRGLW